MIEVYGQGLERILELIDEGDVERRAPRPPGGRRRRRQPDADPRALSGRARRAGRRGARQRAPVHGVARRRRRAARDRATASPGSASRAAATAARPPPRRSSWRSSRRSRRRHPTSRACVVEGAVEAPLPATPGPGSLELPVVQVPRPPRPEPPTWFALGAADELAEGELTTANVDGVELVVARVEGSALAFRDRCAGCGSSLGAAELSEGTLACPECARRFFLPRAGRSLDDDRLLLEPLPLLDGAGGSRVALPARGAAPMSEALDARVAARRQADMVASLRRLSRAPGNGNGAPAQPGRSRSVTSAARGSIPTTATSCTSSTGASSAPARAASRCAAATRSCARPGRGRCGSTTSRSPTRSGPRLGSRSGSRSSSTRAPAAGSSRSIRAPRGRPSRSSRSRPGATCAPPTRCSWASSPTPRR